MQLFLYLPTRDSSGTPSGPSALASQVKLFCRAQFGVYLFHSNILNIVIFTGPLTVKRAGISEI